jgi:hypothetical protein
MNKYFTIFIWNKYILVDLVSYLILNIQIPVLINLLSFTNLYFIILIINKINFIKIIN